MVFSKVIFFRGWRVDGVKRKVIDYRVMFVYFLYIKGFVFFV